MTTFQIAVMETVAKPRLYWVEAESFAEAVAKANIGDTIEESDTGLGEVINREVLDDA